MHSKSLKDIKEILIYKVIDFLYEVLKILEIKNI